MPELKLGTKHDCFNCGTKFYDLGKSEAVCPKCGANQKDAGQGDTAAPSPRRKRKVEAPPKPVDLDEDEPMDISDDEMVTPIELDEEDLGEEEEEDDDAE